MIIKTSGIYSRSVSELQNMFFIILKVFFIFINFLFSSSCLGQFSTEPEAGFFAGQATKPSTSSEPGLLFYLSGEQEFTADFAAGGQVNPIF